MGTRLDPLKVPAGLRGLIPLAEEFGIADDRKRESLASRAPEARKRVLKATVQKFADDLDAWLAGPEAAGPHSSREYIAFSALRMAADYL